jgi:hypothetical protein
MARITLTIEADHEELPTVLSQLFQTVSSDNGVTSDGSEPWDEDEVATFLDMIRPGAREILAEIATRPEGYPWVEVQERLGLSGLQIAGRMSSIGHVLNQFPAKASLHESDYHRREYRMDPEYAHMVLEYVGQR